MTDPANVDVPTEHIEPPTDPELARAQAVTRFYTAADVSIDWLRFQCLDLPDWPIPLRPVAEGLYAGVAIDVGPSYVRATNEHLAGWGIGFDELLDRAIENSMEARDIDIHREAGLVMIEDDLAVAGLFLRPDMTESLTPGGKPVVLPVTRRDALVASDQDQPALLQMASMLLGALRDNELLVASATPQWWDGSRWWPLNWAQLGLPADQIAEIEHRFDLLWYERQRPILKDWLEHTGQDVLVTKYQLFAQPDGGLVSSGSWVCDMPTALPKADRVALVQPDSGDMLALDWDDMVATYGHLMTPLEMTPQRWRVEGWTN